MTGGTRLLGRLALPVLAAGAVTAFAAAPVLAATNNPTVTRGDGSDASASTTAGDTCLKIVGDVPSSLTGSGATVNLVVVEPDGTAHQGDSTKVSATSRQQLSFQFSTGALSWSNSCTGGGQAANGTYQAKLTGGITAATSFKLAIPPAAPGGFTAQANGTVVTFGWQPNSEPDLIGYDILDGSNEVTPGGLDAGSVCGASSCSVDIDFGAAAAGTSHDFHVVAWRHTAPGSSGYLSSPASADRSVTFAAAPSSAPGTGGATTGRSGGTAGTGTGGSATGGASTGRHRTSGKHPAADLKAYLPTLSAGSAPDLPSVLTEVKPLPQGTYKPTLAYGDQTEQVPVHKAAPKGTAAGPADGIARVLDIAGLWRAIAGGAVLLLAAVHLLHWLRRPEPID